MLLLVVSLICLILYKLSGAIHLTKVLEQKTFFIFYQNISFPRGKTERDFIGLKHYHSEKIIRLNLRIFLKTEKVCRRITKRNEESTKLFWLKMQNKESYLFGIAVTFFFLFAVSLIVCARPSKYHRALLMSLKTLCPSSCECIARNGFCCTSIISSLCSTIFLSFRVLRIIVGCFLINTSTIERRGSFAVLASPLD